MAFGAWFRVDDATLLLTAKAVRNASPATAPHSSGCRFPRNRMNRRIQSTYPRSVRMLKRSRRMTVADLIEQPGLAPSRGWVLRLVHAVFSYGRARNPCTISRVVKAL
jgi:hypothetical protein